MGKIIPFEKLFYSLKDSEYDIKNKGWSPYSFRISDGKYLSIAGMTKEIENSALARKGQWQDHIDRTGNWGLFDGMVKDSSGNLYDNSRNGKDYLISGAQTGTVWKTATVPLRTQTPLSDKSNSILVDKTVSIGEVNIGAGTSYQTTTKILPKQVSVIADDSDSKTNPVIVTTDNLKSDAVLEQAKLTEVVKQTEIKKDNKFIFIIGGLLLILFGKDLIK